jgi:beta-xylosidase
MLFVDSGPFGRFPSLQPVTWQDGWPMVGVNEKAVVTYKKPDVGKEYPIKTFPTSDEFDDTELGIQWGWNHNADPTKWSLTKNSGSLRLETVKVVENLAEARNTLTQRMFAYYSDSVATVATTKMDFDNMKEGDIAGLAIFQDPYAYIGIKKTNEKSYVIMVNNGKTIDSVAIDAKTIYLRADPFYGSGAAMYYGGETIPGTGTARFSYSLDNKSFTEIGNEMQMEFKLTVFTGNKFCLFNYATKEPGGYVDFDFFRVKPVAK